MSIHSRFNKMIMALSILSLTICAFLVHALAGLNSIEIAFEKPPEFVDTYALRFGSNTSIETNIQPATLTFTSDYAEETALLHRVFFEDQYDAHKTVLQLFSHPKKAQRIKIAAAFGELNIKYSHNDESGYPEKRKQFWVDVEQHLPNIQNALFETLIMSAKENTPSYLPYTIAWMPGQGDTQETLEVLAWAAKHHSDPWVRRFSHYYVVEFGDDEKLSSELLAHGHLDPAFRVRKQSLHSKYKRLTGQI